MSDRIDTNALRDVAQAATQGRWQWFGNSKMHSVYLATVDRGRVFVMDFERWGMRGAQPRFQIDHRMVTLGELAESEHPLGPQFDVQYRRDFAGIGHPDARHIAASDPATVLGLLRYVDQLESALRQMIDIADHGAVISSDGDDLRALLEKGPTR